MYDITKLVNEIEQLRQDNIDMKSLVSFWRCVKCGHLALDGYICNTCGYDDTDPEQQLSSDTNKD